MPKLRCLLGWHRRSPAERFRDRDELVKSRCLRCGRRMVRDKASGRWRAYANRDFRARSTPVRDLLERLTGPVLFLMLLALLLGLTLWLRGSERLLG